MRISTKDMDAAKKAAGHLPYNVTLCALVIDEVPQSALVRLQDGSYCTYHKGWPTGCDQAQAHKAMNQSEAASHPRTVTEDHRAKLAANLEKARAARATKKRAEGV